MAPPRTKPWTGGSPIGLSDLDAPGNPQQLPVGPRGLRRGRIAPFPGQGLSATFDETDWIFFNGSIDFDLVTNTSTLVLPRPNFIRTALLIRNASAAANVYVQFGTPAGLRSILRIVPGNHVLFDKRVPQDDVYALSDAASGVIVLASSQSAIALPV